MQAQELRAQCLPRTGDEGGSPIRLSRESGKRLPAMKTVLELSCFWCARELRPISCRGYTASKRRTILQKVKEKKDVTKWVVWPLLHALLLSF